MGLLSKHTKLNVGASLHDAEKGWLNIALPDYFEFDSRIIGVEDGIAVYASNLNQAEFIDWDIKLGIPFPDNSLEGIYSSHFIEHLDYQTAIHYLKESYRVLKPGGVLRTICPDLSIWINKLYDNDKNFFDVYKGLISNEFTQNTTREFHTKLTSNIQLFNAMIYNWDHKWMWDLESLSLELERIGYSDVVKTDPFVSKLEGADILEGNLSPEVLKGRLLESLYVDAIK